MREVRNRVYLKELASGLEPPRLLAETFEAEEFDRIRSTLYMALVSEAIPRRQSRLPLEADKRAARKVANAYRTLWLAYDPDGAPAWRSRGERLGVARTAPVESRRAGSIVRWDEFLPVRRADLEVRRRLAAGVALRDGKVRWGVKHVRLLTYEVENVERIERGLS